VILGLLPEIRGGLGALARTGQHTRFVDGYLRAYARAFDEVRYFSYRRESLGDFTEDQQLAARVRIVPGLACHPWLYAAIMGVRHGRALGACAVLRVFHLTGVLPALVTRRRRGVPFVVTYGFRYDELARTRLRAWFHRRLETLALAEADAVIVTTAELQAHVLRRARSPEAVHLLPNAVDAAAFRPVARSAASVPTVLYVGRLSPEKNLQTLIDAVAKLRGRLDVTLRFVGDGALRGALVAGAERAGVRLELLPVVDHGRLPQVYAAADVFVLPSVTEGHPKVLLEAMSCGLPCVASDVGGNRAAIADGRTGLLVNPTDAGAFADAIERVLTDRELARRLGEAARREIVERYDLPSAMEREIALLRAVGARGVRR
jgi:glycosyltransferase involved in cell wall biosynthesis